MEADKSWNLKCSTKLLHWINRFLEVPVVNATCLELVISFLRCLSSLPTMKILDSQRLRTSVLQWSTPLMCTAQISSHLTATNSSSLGYACRNELCILPVFNIITDVSLSHWITMHTPCHSSPHTLAATTTVSNSKALMLRLLLVVENYSLGLPYIT